jgi:hypothetical protein
MATPKRNPDGSIPLNFNPNMTEEPSLPKNPIEDLYRSELGRAADPGGLEFWTNAYNNGMSINDIRDQGFRASEEYKNRPSGLGAISELYRTMLDRKPDEEGLQFWTNALNNGMSLNDIRNQGFFPSEEYQNRIRSNPSGPVKPRVDEYAGTQWAGTGGPGRPYREPPPPIESNYPAGYDPFTGTAITPRPAQIQGFGYGLPKTPYNDDGREVDPKRFDPFRSAILNPPAMAEDPFRSAILNPSSQDSGGLGALNQTQQPMQPFTSSFNDGSATHLGGRNPVTGEFYPGKTFYPEHYNPDPSMADFYNNQERMRWSEPPNAPSFPGTGTVGVDLLTAPKPIIQQTPGVPNPDRNPNWQWGSTGGPRTLPLPAPQNRPNPFLGGLSSLLSKIRSRR